MGGMCYSREDYLQIVFFTVYLLSGRSFDIFTNLFMVFLSVCLGQNTFKAHRTVGKRSFNTYTSNIYYCMLI